MSPAVSPATHAARRPVIVSTAATMPDPGRSPAGGCHLMERKRFYSDAMNPRFLVPPEGVEAHHHDLGWLHMLFALLIVAVLVAGAVIIARMVLHHWTPSAWPRRHPAVDELDLRYARGEIDRAEYLQRRPHPTAR